MTVRELIGGMLGWGNRVVSPSFTFADAKRMIDDWGMDAEVIEEWVPLFLMSPRGWVKVRQVRKGDQ